MAALVRFDTRGRWGKAVTDAHELAHAVRAIGMEHGRWMPRDIGDGSLEAVTAAYRDELDALRERLSIRSVDRVTLQAGTPGWPELRKKFIVEHTHADAEIRFFLGGRGLFYVRLSDGYAGLLCEAGDWVLVPAGTPHFFDGGAQPDFDALRLFAIPQGWEAQPTGAQPPALPLLDEFVARLKEI